jgi:hypothetical protein
MPHLPHSIELHDSELYSLVREGNSIRIYLTPAYIHRDGKGWTQDVEIVINEAAIEGEEVDFPVTLSDGHMQTKLGPYHNLLNIPFAVDGPVHLELELISGAVVTINGKGVEHEFKGEPQFVEEFPST